MNPPDDLTDLFSACNNLGLRTCATEGNHNTGLPAYLSDFSNGKNSFIYTSLKEKALQAHHSFAPEN